MSILQTLPLIKRSIVQRLFRQYPEDNALRELNNMLLDRGWLNVTPTDVNELDRKYQLKVREEFSLNLLEYFIAFLNDSIQSDGWLTPDNYRTTTHIVALFNLNKTVCIELQLKLTEPVYRAKMISALRNGFVSDKDEQSLRSFAESVLMPKEVVTSIRKELTEKRFNQFVATKLKSKRLSPGDDDELHSTAKTLGLKPTLDETTRKAWERLRLLWNLENQELPILQTVQFHDSNENCYFLGSVSWYEQRIHQAVPYLKLIDSGTLMLTNNYLIFTGSIKVVYIKYKEVQDFIRHNEMLEVRKHKGRNPYLSSVQVEEVSIVLARLLAH